MEPLLMDAPPLAAPPELPAVPALLQATGAVLALSMVGAALGGAALLAVPIAGATLYAGLQVAALTVPALVLLQPLAGVDTHPRDTVGALLGGLSEGASLMLALAPLTLFLGMSSPGIHVTLIAYYGCVGLGTITAISTATLRLSAVDPEHPVAARVVAWSWAFVTMLIAYPAAVLALDGLLTLCMGPLFGVRR